MCLQMNVGAIILSVPDLIDVVYFPVLGTDVKKYFQWGMHVYLQYCWLLHLLWCSIL